MTLTTEERAKRLARHLHDEQGWSWREVGEPLGWSAEWTRRWCMDIDYRKKEAS